MAEQRSDVISWDEFFMRVAFAAKLRSKDPNTQVGACIADTDHRILSVGYNGTPHAITDEAFPWGDSDDPLNDKHSYVIHAEANAIISASRRDMMDSTLYLVGKEVSTGEYVKDANSCAMCKRMIINAGIARVVIRDDQEHWREIAVSDWVENDDSMTDVLGY